MCVCVVPVQIIRDADIHTQIDYTTGAPVAPSRQPLKLLMRDRRVDPGMRYSPVFGRYGFLPGNDSPLLLLLSMRVWAMLTRRQI